MSGSVDAVKSDVVASNGIPVSSFHWLADTAACGFYRQMQPARAMARKFNVQVEVGSRSESAFTVLVAQRTHGEEQVEFLEHVKANRQEVNGVSVPKIVYEVDDDLWSIEKSNTDAYRYYNTPGLLSRAEKAIRLADGVTVSTKPLADIVRQWNENVYVLPNSVDVKYFNEMRYPYVLGNVDKPFVIGWSGGSSHLEDFRQCAGSVDTFLRLNPHTRMVFFGTDYSHLLSGSVRDQIRVAPWTKTVPEYLDLLSRASIDVMLAPLEVNTFNESKSNLRIIEANALGIPVIATDWGPYHFGVLDNSSLGVRYVTPGTSWIPALEDLRSNPFARLQMSSDGRKWASENYNQTTNADLWLGAYREILEA